MSEEQKIEERPEDDRPPTTDDGLQTEDNFTPATAGIEIKDQPEPPSSSPVQPPTLQYHSGGDQVGGPTPQTAEMEIHHPHHAHHSKKWKDYLFEFLMLFLAVTLGFFVENQREHYIEGMREKQFIKSLVNDLRSDIVKLTSIINIRTVRASGLDSLKLLVNSDSPNTHTNDIYYLASTAARTLTIRFIPNDGTMQQLKSSGSLRLVRSKDAVDSINLYTSEVSKTFLNTDDMGFKLR